METWEHLTPYQKQQARQLFQQFKQLPPDRRQALNRAIRSMRGLTPEQRERLINSDQYKSAFSPQERALLAGASRLPLAPGDGLTRRTTRRIIGLALSISSFVDAPPELSERNRSFDCLRCARRPFLSQMTHRAVTVLA